MSWHEEFLSTNQKKKSISSLGDLFGLIEEVFEVEKNSLFKNKKSTRELLREQFLNEKKEVSLTLQAIPEISVTELGWTDVRTTGGQEIAGPARQQLLQFVKQISGTDISEKVQSLAQFYSNPQSIDTSGASTGERIAKSLSYLTFYKTLTKVISNFNAASAGFNFEAFLAVLLDGQQIVANTGTIADFKTGDNVPISLKLYNEKSVLVGGSFTDLVGDLVNPQFAPHEYMQYVVVMKSFEGESQGLDVQGNLKFYRFNFTLDNVANIVLNSMGKSVKCIELPVEFVKQIKAGNKDFDYNSVLPSQENLPSTEEMETTFVGALNKLMAKQKLPEEYVTVLTQILDWANNDEIFKAVPKGERDIVVRGQSVIQVSNKALNAGITSFLQSNAVDEEVLAPTTQNRNLIRSMVSAANKVVTDQFTAKKLKSARSAALKKKGVFLSAAKSVEFYNSLDPEMKKRALLNSRGYLDTLQFDLNKGHVLRIQDMAGDYPALPEGQADSRIGTIPIGATYVQEMLNSMTRELNEAIFDIFMSVKDVQEGSYAYVAGGLSDEVDHEAQKAIKASNKIAYKTEELRDTKDLEEQLTPTILMMPGEFIHPDSGDASAGALSASRYWLRAAETANTDAEREEALKNFKTNLSAAEDISAAQAFVAELVTSFFPGTSLTLQGAKRIPTAAAAIAKKARSLLKRGKKLPTQAPVKPRNALNVIPKQYRNMKPKVNNPAPTKKPASPQAPATPKPKSSPAPKIRLRAKKKPDPNTQVSGPPSMGQGVTPKAKDKITQALGSKTRKTKKMGSKESPIGTADTLAPQVKPKPKPKSRSLIDPPKPKARDTIETPPPIPKKRKDK